MLNEFIKSSTISAFLVELLISLDASIALAQSSEASGAAGQQIESAKPDIGYRDPTNLPNQIREDSEDKESRVQPPLIEEFLTKWDAFKGAVYDRTGIRYSLAYAYVFQHASSSAESVSGSGGQAELNFTWDVIGRNSSGQKG